MKKSVYNIKVSIVTAILLVQSILCLGQGVFNKSYDVNGFGFDKAWSIDQVGIDSFLVVSSVVLGNNASFGYGTLLINGLGDTLRSNVFIDSNFRTYVGFANSTNHMQNGNLVMGGGKRLNNIDFGFLAIFNQVGDTIWTKTYGDSVNFYTFRQARETPDGSFIAAGENHLGSLVIKMDSIGNKLWEKSFSSHGDVERFTSVYPTQDKGYILGGLRRHFVPGPYNNNYDPFIVKVDSLGVKEWDYIHDTPYDDQTAYVIQTKDLNYVFGASNSSPNTPLSRASISKVDFNGNLLWLKEFGSYSHNHSFLSVYELTDSSLICAGVRDDSIYNFGLLVKTNPSGDSIFSATYENDPNGINNQNTLFDVIPTDNGDLIAAGEVVGIPPHVPFRQDAWVIRVDSNGCILANCLVGNESLKPKAKSLKIYPNPTSGLINIESEENLNRIEIYNLQGQKVMEVGPAESQFELPQESGLYLVRVTTANGEVVNKKVLKR
jgi:hypothetical protein